MYKAKNIHYKTIFKQDGQSDTIEYFAKGILHIGETSTLEFECDEGIIHISYNENEVVLNHGQSTLRFHPDLEIKNSYHLPYGNVELKTKLIRFKANEESIQMVYELYDQQGLLMKVFLFVNMVPLGDEIN